MPDDDDSVWVAHRTEGWTVESGTCHEPLAVYHRFDDACTDAARRRTPEPGATDGP